MYLGTILFAALLAVLPSGLATIGEEQENDPIDPTLFQAMKWRNVGPHRGGRVTTVAGVAEDPRLYYMGATGGGVWRTENAGSSWQNISDEFFQTGSVGSIAVAPSDPNVIYVGMGEGPIRGVTTSHGDGTYRSTDRGKTWTNVGLAAARQIPKIIVHPDDPDWLYVAAQGNPWAPNPERGVYRSKNGGESWEQVLAVDENTGACDLCMDPTNPRTLFAALWDHRRSPWQVRSGGPGSGLYRSTDAGDSWERLTEGLPDGMGKIGVSISASQPSRVWALVEAEEGGLYRSDNGGDRWKLINRKRVLRARSWYYMHVVADPVDADTVYVLNGPLVKSIDGGKTFDRLRAPHGDHHDLWIHPQNNQWMVNGNDGGANVSFDGGKTWSTQYNQPTAQFYRVITDNRFPYHLYGGQQDNTTVAIASRSEDRGIGREDWYPVAGGESAHIAFDPDHPRLVYATSIAGFITEYDHQTRTERTIQVYPEFALGLNASQVRYRFNWNPPVITSPHDRKVIYYGGNVLFRSADRGNSWQAISPDLTRNEPDKHGPGGVPYTDELAGAEYYNTLFYIAESTQEKGTIWVGTDDGLVQLTRDGGGSWKEVTPSELGEVHINSIDVPAHAKGSAWIAATGYKLGDFSPQIYKTEDYGQSWSKRVARLPEGSFVRVVREDPVRPGLVFAGTETGVWVSFDDAHNWQPLQLKLPHVPITDLRVHGDDLVAATQGRAFWILDGLAPLRQMRPELAEAPQHLFTPDVAYRLGSTGEFVRQPGQNPPKGAVLYLWLKEAPDPERTEVTLEISDASGNLVRSYSNRRSEASECYWNNAEFHGPDDEPYALLKLKAGMNRVLWNLRRENVECIPDYVAQQGWQGPRVAPGTYTLCLGVGDRVQKVDLQVRGDPRRHQADEFSEQQALIGQAYDALNDLHRQVNRTAAVRQQIQQRTEWSEDPSLEAAGEELHQQLSDWEGQLLQRKSETQQDTVGFENKLGTQLQYVMGVLDQNDAVVTDGCRERLGDLWNDWVQHRAELEVLLGEQLNQLNDRYRLSGLPAIFLAESGPHDFP